MEGTIGEIRIFSGNFPPRSWAFCQGQSLSIAQYDTLYAIIGTTYGGDGQETFNLPDLRSKVAMGNGNGPGLTPRILGQVLGTETVTLTTNEMPAHTHPILLTPQGGAVTAAATLYGVNGSGDQTNPGNNYLGEDSNVGAVNYIPTGNTVPMNSGSISISNVNAPAPNLALAQFGGSQAHNNIQPVLAINFIICLEGMFPSRN
jgi:microcystin-dependent protein